MKLTKISKVLFLAAVVISVFAFISCDLFGELLGVTIPTELRGPGAGRQHLIIMSLLLSQLPRFHISGNLKLMPDMMPPGVVRLRSCMKMMR